MNIAEATKPQLIAHARDVLGIELSPTLRVDEIRQAVAEASGTPIVPIEPEKKKTFTIHIAKTDTPSGAQDVFVGVNGRTYLLQRGVDIPNVPASVVGVLKNAVQKRYAQVADPRTGAQMMVEREVQSYPFSIVA